MVLLSDEEIVERVQKGERGQFGVVIDRYQEKLARYVRKMTSLREEDVEEVVAESLIRAYENIQEFDKRKKFSSWIYRITHNRTIDYWRKNKNQVALTEEAEELREDGKKLAEEMEIENEQKERVGKALERLELKCKEVLVLYYFEEKSYEEIADILRLSVSSVGVRLYRAKKELKRKYEQN